MRNRATLNEESIIQYFRLKSKTCSPALFSSKSANERIVFGLSDTIHFCEFDTRKDYRVNGKFLDEETKLLRAGQKADLILTLQIEDIPYNGDACIKFYLNKDEHTALSISFKTNIIQFKYNQSSESNYKEFSDALFTGFRCKCTKLLQLRYNTALEKFTGIITGKGLDDDDCTVHTGEFFTIDKNFIFDWISSESRRISIERKDSHRCNIDITSFTIIRSSGK